MVKGFAGEIESKAQVMGVKPAPSGIITDGMNAVEIAEILRPAVARSLLERLRDGEVGSGDLVKMLGMLSDRIDGKVAEKVEHSGNVCLMEILREIDGKTAGLPVIDGDYDVGYDGGTGIPALTTDVVDGVNILESEEDKLND